MGEQFEYLKEIGTTLFNCSKSKLLCDLVIVTEGIQEVYAHSIMLAAVSSKLRVAFEHFGGTKRNSLFRLNLSDCSFITVEAVMQFVYTGTVSVLGIYDLEDINKFLLTGQKLGLDPTKLGLFLAVLVSYADLSFIPSFPPFVITDDDIYLEVIDKDASPVTAVPLEVIKLTSKVTSTTQKLAGHVPDHSYTQYPDASCGATDVVPSADVQSSSEPEPAAVDLDMGGVDTVTMVPDHLDTDDPNALQVRESYTKSEEECYVDSVAVHDALVPGLDTVAHVNNEELKMLSIIFHNEKLQQSRVKREEELKSVSVEGLEAKTDVDSGSKASESASTSSVSVSVQQNLAGIGKAKPALKFGRGRKGFGLGRGTKQRVILFCDLCGKTFMRSKEYTEHRRSHTGEKPYMCDLCGKSFGRRRTMIEHRRLHTGERPFLCEICDKRFATSGELVKHRRFHTGERPYQCNVCGKTFSRCGENADHRRMHAGENICKICGKEFTRQHNMKEHMNSAHTGQRRYTCGICGKCFAYSSGLRYHRRLHKDERPYTCQLCNKSFARGGELSRHERSAHKSQIVEIEVYS